MAETASPGVLLRKRRGLRLGIALGLVVLLLSAAAGALVVRQRSLQAELQQAREAFGARRFGLASQRLSRLAERWTNDGEVFLLLGNSRVRARQARRGHGRLVQGSGLEPVFWQGRRSPWPPS